MNERNRRLRALPSVDSLLSTEPGQELVARYGRAVTVDALRAALDSARSSLSRDNGGAVDANAVLDAAGDALRQAFQPTLRPVINATGVIVHTNLGRAPLSESARQAVPGRRAGGDVAAGCSALECGLGEGERGSRAIHAEGLLRDVTGAEAALVVNNNAAALVLLLSALAKDREVVISRGQLIEIGGGFRIPDVMAQSGAALVEVGATNRTRLTDYENAINENTRMIVKVHPSNYRIVGFTETPETADIAGLARRRNVLFYEDAGSGALIDLAAFGLSDEPVISRSITAGADVVTFSGDKLLGAAQAGLIVGRGEIIEKLRRHPLFRALRASKLIYAALEATLEAFQREQALEEIPVLKMISLPAEEIKKRTEKFARRLRGKIGYEASLDFEILPGNSVIGGGSAPTVHPATVLLALEHAELTSSELEEKLRASNPPVIARILEDKVLLDLRTVSEAEEEELLKILTELKV